MLVIRLYKLFNIKQSSDTFLKISPMLTDSVVSPLRSQKACMATGLDKIRAKILKLSVNMIAHSLTFIFNLSLATGIYTSRSKHVQRQYWNLGIGDSTCKNYRPTSTSPAVSKVFKKEVFRQVNKF